jgi:hypothetical protein
VDQTTPQKRSYRFPSGPDHPRRGRRPKGVPNKITATLREAIIDAASLHGGDGHGAGALTGYLAFLASSYPHTFAGLLGKLLPYQINGNVISAIASVNVVAVPSDFDQHYHLGWKIFHSHASCFNSHTGRYHRAFTRQRARFRHRDRCTINPSVRVPKTLTIPCRHHK